MWFALVACRDEDPPAPRTPDPPIASLADLVDACEAALGPLPEVDCNRVPEVPIPVTIDGVTRIATSPDDLEDGERCDHPSILSGCRLGSRAGEIAGEGDTRWYLACRHNSPDTPEGLFDETALLGYSPSTGDTCFLGAPHAEDPKPAVLPRPGSDDPDAHFWAELPGLAKLGCPSCHNQDPLIVTPWIAGNLDLTGIDPRGPYRVIGADVLDPFRPGAWVEGPQLVAPATAPCRVCHELTDGVGCLFAQQAIGAQADARTSTAGASWPENHWMDTWDTAALVDRFPTEAAWDAVYGDAADAIVSCCARNPPPGCWSSPSGGGTRPGRPL
jgi:hypothetical protein